MRIRNRKKRGGAAAVEAAIVLPIVFLLVIGLLVGGMAVFHHEEAGNLAQEGARYASVRGSDYERDTNKAAPTKQEIIDAAILPFAVAMDPAELTVQIEWIDQATGVVRDWDASRKEPRSITAGGEYVTNTVRVTVRYRSAPGVFTDPITVGAVSEMPMLH